MANSSRVFVLEAGNAALPAREGGAEVVVQERVDNGGPGGNTALTPWGARMAYNDVEDLRRQTTT